MTEETKTQDGNEALETNLALQRLAALICTWRTDIVMPLDTPIITHGRTDIDWLQLGRFLIMSGSVEHPDFPDGISIIGGDDTNDTYSMLYYDSRGIARIYEMSLSGEVWKLWRQAPGFSQRFTGTFSDGGNSISGSWERSIDGSTWEHDFDLTYTKDKQPQARS